MVAISNAIYLILTRRAIEFAWKRAASFMNKYKDRKRKGVHVRAWLADLHYFFMIFSRCLVAMRFHFHHSLNVSRRLESY